MLQVFWMGYLKNVELLMKRFRFLGTTYTIERLYDVHHFISDEKHYIEEMNIGDSVAFVPGSSCKAYQMTRIK